MKHAHEHFQLLFVIEGVWEIASSTAVYFRLLLSWFRSRHQQKQHHHQQHRAAGDGR